MILLLIILVVGVLSILAIKQKYRGPSVLLVRHYERRVLIDPTKRVSEERCRECKKFGGGDLCFCWQIIGMYDGERLANPCDEGEHDWFTHPPIRTCRTCLQAEIKPMGSPEWFLAGRGTPEEFDKRIQAYHNIHKELSTKLRDGIITASEYSDEIDKVMKELPYKPIMDMDKWAVFLKTPTKQEES